MAYLIQNITGDVEGDPKTVRGPCAVVLEGVVGSAVVTIKLGQVGGTLQAVGIFDATDDDTAEFVNGRGRARYFDMPVGASYDIAASVNGSGDHNLSVALIN